MNGDINVLGSSPFGPDLTIPIGIGMVGAVIVSRRPSNVIGWLLLVAVSSMPREQQRREYAIHALITSAHLPAVPWAAWYSNWVLALVYPTGTFLFVVLLFPRRALHEPALEGACRPGDPPDRFVACPRLVDPTPLNLAPGVPDVANPTGVKGTPFTLANLWYIWLLGLLLLAVAAVGLVLRYRRAAGEERHQIKWFAFAVAASDGAAVISASLSALNTSVVRLGHQHPTRLGLGVALAGRVAASRFSSTASTASTSSSTGPSSSGRLRF